MLPPLRERVARALYEEGWNEGAEKREWAALAAEKRDPWLRDADRVIPIVLDAVKRLIIQRHPDDLRRYLIARANLADVITSTLWTGDFDFECPLGDDACHVNCGAYACGN